MNECYGIWIIGYFLSLGVGFIIGLIIKKDKENDKTNKDEYT